MVGLTFEETGYILFPLEKKMQTQSNKSSEFCFSVFFSLGELVFITNVNNFSWPNITANK